MITVIFLIISNTFMTFAWYGHLKYTRKPLWIVILVSWAIAFLEYCFQVPANRWGYEHGMSPARLKITAEAIALVVFIVFAKFYLGEAFTWNYIVSFVLIMGAVYFAFAFN
ncbi:MAG: DMT family protein [Bacteroidota bacterium]|nr:DMT family protein [Bacteroidota bacterium]MDP4234018.1 DMT family protein [Bacteroidota bacterium]MDP4242884.1 DMT family protein [Bacteroidota bacterium]MDP4287677.1 DMT family protein [Bacteroidota bacterium]